eukprot:802138-Pleurochrysis_carterae.AAC.1
MSNRTPRASTALIAASPMSYTISPGDNRSSWPPKPVHIPPLPTPVLDKLMRALRTAQDEEVSDALCTRGGGEESDAARNTHEMQITAQLNAPCTRRPLAGPAAVRRNPRPATTSEPVTRQLAFNAMGPRWEAMRLIGWSSGFALHSPRTFCSADAPDPSGTG